jgi:hypothetical protein
LGTNRNCTLTNITFQSRASNSIIKGFDITTNVTSDSASSLIIQNNKFGTVYLRNSSNCIIKQNYGGGMHCWWDVWTNNTNVVVSNNIFSNAGTFMNATVEHNILNCDFSAYDHMSFSESIVKSNIIGQAVRCTGEWIGNGWSCGTPATNLNLVSNTTFVKNIFRSDIFGLGTTQNTIDGNTTNYFLGNTSTDGRYQLKQNSPAIGVGEGGADCGAFDGTEPYKLSGIGFNPNIFKVEMPTTGTSQGGLPVKVLISANQ